MHYKVTVGTNPTMIIPDGTKTVESTQPFATGETVSNGDYRHNEDNEIVYVAKNDGTVNTIPTHNRGWKTIDGIEWLAIPPQRHAIVNADRADVSVWIARDDSPVVGEGIPLDLIAGAIDFGRNPAPVYGVTESGEATVTVEMSAG